MAFKRVESRSLEIANSRANRSRAECWRILDVIERVENRCMAVDGPVTPTNQEITNDELILIYKAAKQGTKL